MANDEHREHRLRQLLNQLPHCVFSVDTEDRYLAVNTASCEALGGTESEIIGRSAVEMGVPFETARPWLELNALTRHAGRTQTAEHTLTVGQRTRKLRAVTSPMRDGSGAIVGVAGISVDVTELAEATMRHLMRAVEQLNEVVFTTDRDGVIQYVNPAFEKLYGWRRDDAVGKTPRVLKSGEIPPEQFELMWSELLSGRSYRMDCRNRTKDGALLDVVASASPMFDDDGIVSGFVAMQLDVTAEKRASAERRRHDERFRHLARLEALGTLAGGIAHNFNNILSIILTHVTLIERELGSGQAAARNVATVKQAVRRGAALSRQILTFAERAETHAENVAVATLVRELGAILLQTLPDTIHLTLDVDPNLPQLHGDSSQLDEALLNLCLNACEAMPSGGDLTIQASLVPAEDMTTRFPDATATDHICLVVADTGTGMSEETRRHVFEPFFTTKAPGNNTGLGLAFVYGVVNRHGGWIDVESRLGQGTTVRIYLPIIPGSGSDPESPPTAPERL